MTFDMESNQLLRQYTDLDLLRILLLSSLLLKIIMISKSAQQLVIFHGDHNANLYLLRNRKV